MGQTFSVLQEYNSNDCSGDVLKFETSRDPIPCIPVACQSISGSGSRQMTCATQPTAPLPPSSLLCPTCAYCQKTRWSPETTCPPGVTPSGNTVIALGRCAPYLGGLYVVYDYDCDTEGAPKLPVYYEDSVCTIPYTGSGGSGTLPPTPSCSPGLGTCFPAFERSTRGQCNYFGAPTSTTAGPLTTTSSTTTTPSGGSILSWSVASMILCALFTIFWLFQ